jgi:hypothetical protein
MSLILEHFCPMSLNYNAFHGWPDLPGIVGLLPTTETPVVQSRGGLTAALSCGRTEAAEAGVYPRPHRAGLGARRWCADQLVQREGQPAGEGGGRRIAGARAGEAVSFSAWLGPPSPLSGLDPVVFSAFLGRFCRPRSCSPCPCPWICSTSAWSLPCP